MPSIKNQMNASIAANQTNPTSVAATSYNISLSALQLAAKTFNDWKLTQWQAKYALDTLQLVT